MKKPANAKTIKNAAKSNKADVKKVKKVKAVAAPKKVKAVEEKAIAENRQLNAYEFAEKLIADKMMKRPTAIAARKLLIGDVIEVFYADQKKRVLEVVVKCASKGEDIFDVATVTQDGWGMRSDKMTKVNSDLWRKVGRMEFKFTKD